MMDFKVHIEDDAQSEHSLTRWSDTDHRMEGPKWDLYPRSIGGQYDLKALKGKRGQESFSHSHQKTSGPTSGSLCRDRRHKIDRRLQAERKRNRALGSTLAGVHCRLGKEEVKDGCEEKEGYSPQILR